MESQLAPDLASTAVKLLFMPPQGTFFSWRWDPEKWLWTQWAKC